MTFSRNHYQIGTDLALSFYTMSNYRSDSFNKLLME